MLGVPSGGPGVDSSRARLPQVFGLRHFRPSTADGRANFADAVLAIGTGVLLAWVVPLLAMLLRVQGSPPRGRSLESRLFVPQR